VSPAGNAGVRIAAPAKINLYLHVTARRDDGFHVLDSLVVFADVGDVLTMVPSPTLELKISGPHSRALENLGDDNIILRAARGLADLGGIVAGAEIRLEKNLPVAAGIGGGSADAAAALKGLATLWDVAPAPPALAELALSLGADVPVCLAGSAAYFGGVGELITPVPDMPEFHLLLVNPGVAVSTPEVFKARKGAFHPAARLSAMPVTAAEMGDALRARHNDLESAAMTLQPIIGDVIDMLVASPGCLFARMSGSGATCFGIFADEALMQDAAAAISLARPTWWVAGSAERQRAVSVEQIRPA
jgi:4-diphosphocytidyl-2-C-methyl-D-erythritol kinase